MFGSSLSKNQVAGIEGILDAFQTHGDGRIQTLAYGLATAYHETGASMVPIKETVMQYHKNKYPTDAQVIGRLDRWAKKTGRISNIYWRPHPKTGKAYFGRGHVQLTWIDNYSGSSADAGFDLVDNPDKMLVPEISARVLFKGLLDGRWNGHGKGIAYYLPSNGETDLRNARRTVNVLDKWQVIALHYAGFTTAIKAAGGVSKQAPTTPRRKPAAPLTAPVRPPQPTSSKGLGTLFDAIMKLLKGFSK